MKIMHLLANVSRCRVFVALGLLSVSKRIGGPDVAEHGMTGKNEREKTYMN